MTKTAHTMFIVSSAPARAAPRGSAMTSHA